MTGNRDSIDYFDNEENKKDEKDANHNSTLLGEYYISVNGYTNSFYSIYYYVSNTDNTIQESNLLESGIVYTSTIEWNMPKLLHFYNNDKNKEEKKPYIISTYAANCVGNFTIENKKSSSDDDDEDKAKLEVIKSNRNYVTQHNQAVILPEMKLFNERVYDLHYLAKDFHHKTLYDKSSCLFYISGITYGKELLLSEGIPHFFTFEPSQKLFTFNYVYPHVFHDKNPALIDIFYLNKVMDLSVKISFETNSSNNTTNNNKDVFTYSLLGPKTILIKPETFQKNCGNYFNCNVHISVTYPENKIKTFSDLTYKITARSNNAIPTYLQKNVIKEDAVLPNVYQYHYTDISENESGRIRLKSKSDSGILVGKIVKKNTIKDSNNSNLNKRNIVMPTVENSELKFNHLSNSLEFDSTQTAKCEEGCEIYIGVISRNYENFKDNMFQYSIIVNTGNILLAINSHFSGIFKQVDINNNIQYFTIEVPEDKIWTVGFKLNFKDRVKGKLLVNVGELTEDIPLPSAEKNNYYTSSEKNSIYYNFKLNKKSMKFIVGVYVDPNLYKNSTSTIPINYDFYSGDDSNLINKNFFEIKLGQNPLCNTEYEDSYCDFLMILSTDDTIIFYTNFIKTFFNKFEKHYIDTVILANVYETSQYSDIVKNENIRPRLHNSPNFRSDVITDSFKEFSQFPDNNILIFKNPYGYNDNKNKTFTHNVLCVSVYLKKPSTFTLMNNKKITPSAILQPETNVEHLYYVDTFNALNIEVPQMIFNKKRNLIGKDEAMKNSVFSVSIKSLIGDGYINYELNNYKLGHERKNIKIIIGEGNSRKLKVNSYSDQKIKLKPYLCIISLNYSPIETNLIMGETLDMLFPSFYYPKKFFYFNYNDTLIEDDIDISFNFKVLDYKGEKAYNSIGKYEEFLLKTKKIDEKDLLKETKMEDIIYNLGEYDSVNLVVKKYKKNYKILKLN